MIVGRDEGDFGKGRGIVERGYGGATGPVVFVFWVGFFFLHILQNCNKGNNSHIFFSKMKTDTVNVYNFIFLNKENNYLAGFL